MECSVCLERYMAIGPRKPVLLPHCGHTLCEECALCLCRQSSLSLCPTCRVPIGAAAAQGSLPPNYALIAVLSENIPRVSSSNNTIRCHHHPSKELSFFCVTTGNFICKKCCVHIPDNDKHQHIPYGKAVWSILYLLEAVVQELTAAHTATSELIPRLKKAKEQHLLLFDNAIQQADVILRSRIEDLMRYKTAVTLTLTSLREEWAAFWNRLESSATGHAWFLQSKLRHILESNNLSDQQHFRGQFSAYVRRKRDNLNPNNFPSHVTAVSEECNDEISSLVGATNKRLRLVRTDRKVFNHSQSETSSSSNDVSPRGSTAVLVTSGTTTTTTTTTTSPSTYFNNNMSNPTETSTHLDNGTIGFLRQLEQLSLTNSVTTNDNNNNDCFAHKNSILPPQRINPDVEEIYKTEVHNAIRTTSIEHSVDANKPFIKNYNNDDYPKTFRHLNQLLNHLIISWQTFRAIQGLRGILLKFNMNYQLKPPNEFSNVVSDGISMEQPYPDYPMFRYPQVFPGLQPPLELLLTVECCLLESQ